MNCSNSSWSFLLGWYEIVCCIFKTRLSGKIMAFLGKKMGNNHLHYIQTIFISKKHFRAGENFVVFLLVSNHNCNQFCNIVGAYFRQAPMWYFLSQPLSIFQNTLLLWQGIFSRSNAKISSWYKTVEVYHPDSFSRFTVVL